MHQMMLWPALEVRRKLKELRAKKLSELREALTKNSKIDFQTKWETLVDLANDLVHKSFFSQITLFNTK